MATDMREQVPDETTQASMIDMIYGLINTRGTRLRLAHHAGLGPG